MNIPENSISVSNAASGEIGKKFNNRITKDLTSSILPHKVISILSKRDKTAKTAERERLRS
jgi:hypothetical protein